MANSLASLKAVLQRRKAVSLAEEERVVAKTKQRLVYLQSQMESQGYLDRQRGVGVGKGLLRSEARRANRGGHQVAKLVRGTSPWLGE